MNPGARAALLRAATKSGSNAARKSKDTFGYGKVDSPLIWKEKNEDTHPHRKGNNEQRTALKDKRRVIVRAWAMKQDHEWPLIELIQYLHGLGGHTYYPSTIQADVNFFIKEGLLISRTVPPNKNYYTLS